MQKYTFLILGVALLALLTWLAPVVPFVISGIALILLVLFRPSEGGGLAGAFGGAGGDTPLGVKATQLIDKVVVVVAVVFIVVAVWMTYVNSDELTDPAGGNQRQSQVDTDRADDLRIDV